MQEVLVMRMVIAQEVLVMKMVRVQEMTQAMGVLDYHRRRSKDKEEGIHSSPSAIEMEEKEPFLRVNSGKLSGEKKNLLLEA